MDENIKRSYETLLDPIVLRPRIITFALFISIFESFQDRTISRIRDFYATQFSGLESLPSEKYKAEVLKLNASPINASLAWLKQNSVIDDADIEAFHRARRKRNELAHGLMKIIGTTIPFEDIQKWFSEIISLSHKIEHWWIKNVEIPTNPDFDGQEITDEDIKPGSTMMIQLLLDVALGDEAQSQYYINEWRNKFGNT